MQRSMIGWDGTPSGETRVKNARENPKSLMALGVRDFDAADYLKGDDAIAAYLTAALEDPDP